VVSRMIVDVEVKNIIHSFTRDSHPMSILMAAVAMLSGKYGKKYDVKNDDLITKMSIDLVAKVFAISSYIFRYINNLDEILVDKTKSFIENVIDMMFCGMPAYEHKKSVMSAFDKILILHADHEQNASTSTVRTCGSSGSNPFAAVSAGSASLWGPAHGGANEAVIKMLAEIGSVNNIPTYIKRAKDKNDSFRLMGFGHRVYKHYDPRAEVLRETCKEVLEELGQLKGNPMLEIAMELEKIDLHDEYFIERKLYPNVDFYSGIIYKAMGIPASMFTVLFAVARTAGWVSQWKEMWEDQEFKITRPRQLYTGHVKRTL